METRLKMRISRMFRSSLASCRARNFSDVTEQAVFPQQSHRGGFHPIDPSSPKARPFPSICGPKALETSETIDSSLPRKKVSEWPSSPFLCGKGNLEGKPCPPVSPITPLNPIYEDEFGYCEKLRHSGKNDKSKKKTTKKKKKERRKKRKPSDLFPFNSCAQDGTIGGYWWYSNNDDDDSEGEDETETLFSSRSHSSDSSRSRRRRHRSRRKKKVDGDPLGSGRLSSEMGGGVMPLKRSVKDTFAVVKRSSDPYNDFRTSMVEMIVEKQIFAPKDLENLLQCFLSLNAHNHHKIIVEVFTEIWEALFSDWL